MGKVAAFISMFTFCFFAIAGALLFIPFLLVYINWDLSVISINWSFVYLLLRLNILLSMVVGLLFMTSKEGKMFADEFNEYIKTKFKK